jgi:hypothetical protein
MLDVCIRINKKPPKYSKDKKFMLPVEEQTTIYYFEAGHCIIKKDEK